MKVFLFITWILFFLLTADVKDIFTRIFLNLSFLGFIMFYYYKDKLLDIFIQGAEHISPASKVEYMRLLKVVGHKKPGIYMWAITLLIGLMWLQTNSIEYICTPYSGYAVGQGKAIVGLTMDIGNCWLASRTPESIRDTLVSLHTIMRILFPVAAIVLLGKKILYDIYTGIITKRYRVMLGWLLVLFMAIILTILQLLR